MDIGVEQDEVIVEPIEDPFTDAETDDERTPEPIEVEREEAPA